MILKEHTLKEQKRALRTEFKAMRAQIASLDYSKDACRLIVEKISSIGEFISADTLLLYYPIGDEPNFLALFDIAKSARKRIAFPRTLPDMTMEFKYIYSLDELVCAGKYSIPEPTAYAETALDFDNSLCITPALAFDKTCHRLGYGGGFYDKFLEGYTGVTVGASYDALLLDSLPCGDFDVPLDIIITERRILKGGNSKKEKD